MAETAEAADASVTEEDTGQSLTRLGIRVATTVLRRGDSGS